MAVVNGSILRRAAVAVGLLGAGVDPVVPMAIAAEAEVAAPAGVDVQSLASRIRPSIVVVTHEGRDGGQEGLGTGFVIDPAGLIATNLHVAGEGRPLEVKFADGRRFPVVEVTASDRSLDLAVLRIEPPATGLDPLPLGSSSDLPDGLPIVTVGNPLGLTFSVVHGVVSGTREVDGREMIQLAMPIEPGNSGGPVVDPDGKVIGIVTIKSLVTRNLGFAMGVDDLRPLLEKPNPVPMARWLTLGVPDPAVWTTHFGARWRQLGSRIAVSGAGDGFGGRSLCLAVEPPPALPYEANVMVKLDDERGAAGLVFHADGGDDHYGFYPSGGRLRVSRFSGPTVADWAVLREVATPRYRSGDWNTLTVRVEAGRFECACNGETVAIVADDRLTGGRVGLAKFRDTEAEFKRFRVVSAGADDRLDPAVAARIDAAMDRLPGLDALTEADLAALSRDAEPAAAALLAEAAALEDRVAELRLVAADVRTTDVVATLTEILAAEDGGDLLRAALEVARLDDEDLDIDDYVARVERMAAEIRSTLPADADETARRAALDRHLFTENGFHGSRNDYYHRANSHVSRVLDDREGLPITLAILYMELGRRLDLAIEGVGLPGHFVVRHVPATGEPTLIDVFEGAVPLSREEAAAKVAAIAGRPLQDSHLSPFTNRQIIQRVLRNLLGVARDARDREAMLRYLEALVALDPADTADRGLLAVVRYETGRRAAAVAALDCLLEREPPDADLEAIRALRTRFLDGPR
jgi:serine protease Do